MSPKIGGDDYCYLTTTGRRSGGPHRIEIWYAAHANTLYLLSGGGRSSDWVQNLRADPKVLVEVDGDIRPAQGRIIEAAEEAEQARSLVFAKYAPRYDGDLTRWRDRALPIAIDVNT
jgi:deazaflavin-dependent oxidoreductase (nitroreductase family)